MILLFLPLIKDHAKASTVVHKSNARTPTPPEKIKVEPSIAMVKDLLEEDIDGHVIYFCEEAARIAKPNIKDKHRPIVGMPVVFVKIGDHCYHGLCDMGASVSVIPYTLYIQNYERHSTCRVRRHRSYYY